MLRPPAPVCFLNTAGDPCNQCAVGYATSAGHDQACNLCDAGYADALFGSTCWEACSGCKSGGDCPAPCKTECPSYDYDGVVNCRPCKAGDSGCWCEAGSVWNSTAGACGKHPAPCSAGQIHALFCQWFHGNLAATHLFHKPPASRQPRAAALAAGTL
jgi:hypothetical protein